MVPSIPSDTLIKCSQSSYQSGTLSVDSMDKKGIFPNNVIYDTQQLACPGNRTLLLTEIHPQLVPLVRIIATLQPNHNYIKRWCRHYTVMQTDWFGQAVPEKVWWDQANKRPAFLYQRPLHQSHQHPWCSGYSICPLNKGSGFHSPPNPPLFLFVKTIFS